MRKHPDAARDVEIGSGSALDEARNHAGETVALKNSWFAREDEVDRKYRLGSG